MNTYMNRIDIINRAKQDILHFINKEHEKGYIQFVVKRKERKVIGFLQSSCVGDDEVYLKTVAKCHSEDTFNEYIGKAIVIRKIFGIPVPEYYTNDYIKGKPENGDVVYNDNTFYAVADYNISLRDVAFDNYCMGRCHISYAHGKVVDDTGYIEELTKNSNMPQNTPTLSCYDRVKNECNGGCQGCSDCIIAQYYRGDRETMPTKKEMKEYIKEIRKSRREINKIVNDPEFEKEIETLINNLKMKKSNKNE